MVKNYPTGGAEGLAHRKLDVGYLGKFLGAGDYALKNVISFCAILLSLIILGLVILPLFTKDYDNSIKILVIIVPLFTLVIGYLTGAIRN